jgi:aldose 1-epimerase
MRLQAGDAELVLAPEMGGAVVSWTIGGEPIFRAANPEAKSSRDHACYPLFPFSNRVANRRFAWDGMTYELPPLIAQWAIHGAAWQRPWRQEGDAMVIDYAPSGLWPFAFRGEQAFDLRPNGLTIRLTIVNTHDEAVPCAIGIHPFFWRDAATRVRLPVQTYWVPDAEKIPVGKAPVPPEFDFRHERALDDVDIDHCFSGWDGTARIVWPGRGRKLDMRCTEPLRHVVFYTPTGRPHFAIEPVSNRNDALNHMHDSDDHGMVVLAPGETVSGDVEMTVSPL